MDALTDRSLSFVTRWHHRPDMGQRETLAEHVGYVARIAMRLADDLPDTIDRTAMYEMALLHDEAEIVTGDIPHPAKALIGNVEDIEKKVAQSLFKRTARPLHYRCMLLQAINGKTLEAKIVHAADKIAALAYAMMQARMGNKYFAPLVNGMLRDAITALSDLPGTSATVAKLIGEVRAEGHDYF